MAQDLRSIIPPTFPRLEPADIRIVGEHPVGAGGFANIWDALHDGRKVILKSYRRYLMFDVTEVITVHFNGFIKDTADNSLAEV